jgi:uncharacterized membrane protein YeaQ/YmgE (transglycosylase-associated protein family)
LSVVVREGLSLTAASAAEFPRAPSRVAIERRPNATTTKEANMGIIVWLLVGLVAGLIARAVVPGPDPMSWVGTMLLGLVGSLVGGFIGDALMKGDQRFSPAGLIGSIIGAVVVLVVWRAMTRGGSRRATI